MDNCKLIQQAMKAMHFAYSPYSNFMVGAALLGNDGKVYLGCNIENASFSATNCAERTAIFKAVSDGTTNFKKIAIVGGQNGVITDFVVPCGICRQVLCEFCDDNFTIVLAKSEDDYIEYRLNELLPISFNKSHLGGKR